MEIKTAFELLKDAKIEPKKEGYTKEEIEKFDTALFSKKWVSVESLKEHLDELRSTMKKNTDSNTRLSQYYALNKLEEDLS